MRALSIPAVLASLSFARVAQDGQAVGRPLLLGPAEQHPPGVQLADVPMPPRALFAPGAPMVPAIPSGVSTRPQPTTPPTDMRAVGAPGAPCDIVAHTGSSVRPAGAVLHTVGEPSVALAGTTMADSDTAFYTGNRFAACRATAAGPGRT